MDLEPRPRWFPLKVRKQDKETAANSNTAVNGGKNAGGSYNGDEDKPKSVADDEDDEDAISVEDEVSAEEDGEDEPPPQGWNIDQLRENMFAFIDGSGNIVYERIDKSDSKGKEETKESDEEEEEEEKEEEREDDSDRHDSRSAYKQKSQMQNDESKTAQIITSSSVMVIDPKTKSPEAVQREEPLPRIKCGAIVHRNNLFIYGGIVEIGDREVTLDDMWSFDLRKRNEWKCLWPGTMHKQVWRGAIHDDDDSYISTGADDDDDDDEDDIIDNDDDDDDDDNSDDSGKAKEQKSQTKDRAELKKEIAELNSKFDLENEYQTPREGEALAEFFSRTADYWNEKALGLLKQSGGTSEPSKKELKREGFKLARERFEQLEPVMVLLRELKLEKKGSKAKKSKKNQ